MSPRQWTPRQREAFSERRAELAVSAAAGSGKTAVLIERVVRAALGIVTAPDGSEQCDPAQRVGLDRVLVVTFTRAAAAELRARLFEELSSAQHNPGTCQVPPGLIREQLAALARAQISTIHSFCGEVARRYGHLAGISHARRLDEDEAALLRHELATEYLDERLGADADPALRRLALDWGGADGVGPEDLSRVRFAGGLRGTMLGLLDFRRAQPDPDHWYAQHCDYPPLDPKSCDPQHPILAALAAELAGWVDQAAQHDEETHGMLAACSTARYHEILSYRLAQYRRIDLAAGWDAAGEALRGLTAELPFRKNWNYLTGYRNDLKKDWPEFYELVPRRNEPVQKQARKWIERFNQPWHEVARHENETRGLLDTLWRLTAGFDDYYSAYKRGRGCADFDDLQRDALRVLAAVDGSGRLMRDAAGGLVPTDAALELRRRFAMVLVDEHQDTNELQDTLIDMVTRDAPAGPEGGGRPRFFVGDLKQSIYTFRQAVPQLFAGARQRLEKMPDEQGRAIRLQTNFRSRPLLLTAINTIFENVLTTELGGEEYSENRLLAPEQAPSAPATVDGAGHGPPAQLHLVLADSEAHDAGTVEDETAGELEDPGKLELGYRHLATVLRGIHDSGDPVRDKVSGELRSIEWRDMVVLMRSTTGRIETLLSSLTRAGVPAYAPGRSGFYERPEISDALSLLRVIDNPRQDIALAAVLRGPAAGLDARQLLAVARSRPEQDADGAAPELWERLVHCRDNEADPDLRDRLQRFTVRLEDWRERARLLSVPELVWQVYADTGLLVAAAGLAAGGQRVANLYRLHDLARRTAGFERQGLARFLRMLDLSRRAAGDLGEAPTLTAAQDVVRVMTVHQSKGLEFPLVAVPDLDKSFNLLDLNGDVLWHRRCGIGGRHVQWNLPENAITAPAEYEPPRRSATLSYHQARQARRNDIVAEELRILYVALTRARERLVLAGTIGAKRLENLSEEHAGGEANCWLDWVAPQLCSGVTAACEAEDKQAQCGAGGCWTVRFHDSAAAARAAVAKTAAALEISADDLAVVSARLDPGYSLPGSTLLPAKLTVTRLSHLPAALPDADPAVEFAPPVQPAPVAEVVPEFMRVAAGRALRPGAAELGTAYHLLLAGLDLRTDVAEDTVAGLRDRLVDAGRLTVEAAAAIEPVRIVTAVSALRRTVNLDAAALYPELPVAMLVAGRDGELLEQLAQATGRAPDAQAVHPDDQVYVQGVIDLLAVDGDAVTVVDYKTDRRADSAELIRRYSRQLTWYCRMVRALLPGRQVRWAILGLDGAGVVMPPG